MPNVPRISPGGRCKLVLVSVFFFLFGCGASQQFVAVPSEINRESVPTQSVEMTAERFRFTPEVLNFKQGTLVQLKIKSIQGTHAFQLGAFGIDVTIEENETKLVEFYASKKGEYGFRCSHFCGLGHLGMTGKIVIE